RGVDERNLAEPPPAAGPVAVDVRSDEVAIFAVARVEPDELAGAKLAAQPFDHAALEGERERARERSLRRSRVGARERLLGGEVRRDLCAVGRLLLTAEPARRRDQADVERGPRPTQLEPPELEPRQLRGPPGERARVLE